MSKGFAQVAGHNTRVKEKCYGKKSHNAKVEGGFSDTVNFRRLDAYLEFALFLGPFYI